VSYGNTFFLQSGFMGFSNLYLGCIFKFLYSGETVSSQGLFIFQIICTVQFQNHALSLTKEIEIGLDGKPCFSSLHDENFVSDIYLIF
jgi:hypothetical protein